MAGISLRLAGFLVLLSVSAALVSGSTADAAAPTTRFEQAKTKATVIYRKYFRKRFDASVIYDKALNEEVATLSAQWNKALEDAVQLSPAVQRARRAYEQAQRNPSDDDPDVEYRRLEDLQIVTQSVRGDIESEIHQRATDLDSGDEDASAPVQPVGAWNAEFLAYGGGVSTQSFGANYHPDVFGGRASFGLMLPQNFRLQFAVQGEQTGTYCPACQDRSYISYSTHLDWKLTSRFEVGAFGGVQDAHPTFGAPSNTNYFLGGETRYNGGWWMTGLQVGYFDVARGPGTLTNAWYIQGRAKVSLGRFLGSSSYINPVLGGSIGYASGDLSSSFLRAQSTEWSVTLLQPIYGTPVSAFAGFHHYTNKVESIGTVWNESIIKGGIKIDLFNAPPSAPTVERSHPDPFVLRTSLTF